MRELTVVEQRAVAGGGIDEIIDRVLEWLGGAFGNMGHALFGFFGNSNPNDIEFNVQVQGPTNVGGMPVDVDVTVKGTVSPFNTQISVEIPGLGSIPFLNIGVQGTGGGKPDPIDYPPTHPSSVPVYEAA